MFSWRRVRRRFCFPHFLQLSVQTARTRDFESKRRGRKKLGDDDPDTLTSVNNLAACLEAQGRLQEAEPLFRELLNGRREARRAGIDCSLRVKAVTVLRKLCTLPALPSRPSQGRSELDELHPDTLGIMYALAMLMEKMGRKDEAERLYREEFQLCPWALTEASVGAWSMSRGFAEVNAQTAQQMRTP